MVSSGFTPDSTTVSAYRLVIHLVLALALFAAIFWTALSTLEPVPTSIPSGHRLRVMAAGDRGWDRLEGGEGGPNLYPQRP